MYTYYILYIFYIYIIYIYIEREINRQIDRYMFWVILLIFLLVNQSLNYFVVNSLWSLLAILLPIKSPVVSWEQMYARLLNHVDNNC